MMDLCGGVLGVNPFEVEMGSLLDSFGIFDSLILKLNLLDRVIIFFAYERSLYFCLQLLARYFTIFVTNILLPPYRLYGAFYGGFFLFLTCVG